MALKFCANLSFMFTESTEDLLERYQLASQAGFKAVECAFPYSYPVDDVVKAKTNANVKQVLLNTYPGNLDRGDFGLAAVFGKQQEFRDSLEKSISYANALGCTKLHIMSGKSFSSFIDTAMADVYRENLQYAAKMLEENGIVGLIEPISNAIVPNYYMNNFKTALEIVKDINSKSLRLQLDIFHLQLLEGNLTSKIKELLPYTGHIQISQAPHRHEPDSDGEIDYRYILKLLEELGYDDYIGLEYKPTASSAGSLGWIEKWGYRL